jgi:hypothetical protein
MGTTFLPLSSHDTAGAAVVAGVAELAVQAAHASRKQLAASSATDRGLKTLLMPISPPFR